MTKTRDTADIVTDAAATYLTQSSASSTYAEQDDVTTLAAPVTNRNLIYNGAMQIHQRGTSTTSITTSGYYTADRWQINLDSIGTWTQTSENDAPTGSGFRKSTKLLCTTADSTPAAGDYVLFEQILEGQDLQRIKKGTSAAEQLTISFWVKSNVTGTYVANLIDADNTRSVSAQYTISASGTWEKKTITFPADTTGAFDNDNARSLDCQFWLGAGTNFTSGTLNTTWASIVNANRAVGQTNLAAATNNYWQITGVQLEVGNTATPFEFEAYGQELAECQRYYWRATATSNPYSQFGVGAPVDSTDFLGQIQHPVPMRVPPTSIEFSNIGITNFGTTGYSATNIIISGDRSGTNSTLIGVTSSGLTAGQFCFVNANNNTSAYIAFGAEL